MHHTLVLSSEPFSSKYRNKAKKSQAQPCLTAPCLVRELILLLVVQSVTGWQPTPLSTERILNGTQNSLLESCYVEMIMQQWFSTHCCSVAESCLTLRPHGLYPTRLLCPRNSPGKNTGVCCHCLHFPHSGIEPRFPMLQVDSLPSEPSGKPSHSNP